MEFENGFWNSENVSEMYSLDNAEETTLHPFVAELINNLNKNTVLDYGCGNAFFTTLLNPQIKVSLFDKNTESLNRVYQMRKEEGFNCIKIVDEKNIKPNSYDIIILSFVLVCIKNEEDRLSLLKKLYNFKKEGGKLIFVCTHPCFRQYENTSCVTSFSFDNFDYLNYSLPFTLSMKNGNAKPVTFTDYHFPLSHTINQFITAGFRLNKLIEMPSLPYKGREYNPQISPFLISIFN